MNIKAPLYLLIFYTFACINMYPHPPNGPHLQENERTIPEPSETHHVIHRVERSDRIKRSKPKDIIHFCQLKRVNKRKKKKPKREGGHPKQNFNKPPTPPIQHIFYQQIHSYLNLNPHIPFRITYLPPPQLQLQLLHRLFLSPSLRHRSSGL